MALEAGELTLTLEFASELKDTEWFGRQDPYAIITIGGQTYRSKTCTDGGKNPVWNETFKFNVINENDFSITVKDKDVVGSDDYIGHGQGQLAKVRTYGQDKQQVSMLSKKGKQHGFVQVSLVFTKNSAIGGAPPGAYGAPPPQYGAPPPYGAPYGAPPPYGAPYGAPPPAYGAPPAYAGPGGYPYSGAYPPQQPPPYGMPPQGAYPPPQGAPYPPQQGYPPQQQQQQWPPQQYPPQQGYPSAH